MCAVYLTLLLYLSRLKHVDGSLAEPVQKGFAWRQTNHALEVTYTALNNLKEEWLDVLKLCPSDLVAAGFTVPLKMFCVLIVLVGKKLITVMMVSAQLVRTDA
jgi:hypothetical protein